MQSISSYFSSLQRAFWERLKNGIDNSDLEIEIAKAQFQSTSSQSPFLYIVRLICAWAVALALLGAAAPVHVLIYPVLWSAWVARRVWVLWFGKRKAPETADVLATWRRKTFIISLAATIIFNIWALTLFPYGTDLSKGLIFTAILVGNMAALSSLTHFRLAALGSALSSTALYVIFFVGYGDPAYLWLTLFGVLITVLAIAIEANTNRNFISLIVTGKELREQTHHLAEQYKETERLHEVNTRIANLDPRTGIPHQRYFRDLLEQEFEAAKASNTGLGICIFDVGGLKQITDIYGLDACDQVFKELARRLIVLEARNMVIGRLGGDEFGFFGRFNQSELEEFRRTFERLVSVPIDTKQGQFRPLYSAGIAQTSASINTATGLFERASFALAVAKQNPNAATVVFDQSLEDDKKRKTAVFKALQCKGMEADLSLVYQPIVDVWTNRINSVECLARWSHPELGNIPPSDFIPLAEQSGVINQISLALFDKVLTETANWPQTLGLSFNLSAANLSSRGFILDFLRILKRHGVPASRLSCEVTETSLMWDFNETVRALNLLKDNGVKVSLDDFGTGYSSLSHVHDLPLDCIKIDRQFVTGIATDTNGYRIVKSLLGLSRDMNVSSVVEGVETEAELAVLKEIGCEQVQGYYYSRPVDANALSKLLINGIGNTDNSSVRPKAIAT